MKISDGKISASLAKAFGGDIRACPLCSHENWNYDNTIFELREYQKGGLVIGGGNLIPMLVICCNNCGNTYFLNAIILGLLDKTGNEVEGGGK